MNLTEDEKIEIKIKVEKYLESGNPIDFLRKIGVMNFDGNINYDRAKKVLNIVAEHEEVIKAAIEGMGGEIKQREKEKEEIGTADNGIIIN